MTAFEFDQPKQAGTNRSAAITDCETCGGDRLVEVEPDVYARCPSCNAVPAREPVDVSSWWKE